MSDVAVLGIRIQSQEVQQATARLQEMQRAAGVESGTNCGALQSKGTIRTDAAGHGKACGAAKPGHLVSRQDNERLSGSSRSDCRRGAGGDRRAWRVRNAGSARHNARAFGRVTTQ